MGATQTLFITSNIPVNWANISVHYTGGAQGGANAGQGGKAMTAADGSARFDFKVDYRSQEPVRVDVAFYAQPMPYPKCTTYFKAL